MQFLVTLMSLLAVAHAKPTSKHHRTTCGVTGYDKVSPNAYYSAVDTDPSACAALCASQDGCKSLATGEGNCLLYASTVTDNFVANAGSSYVFNDLSCMPPVKSVK
ncbi:hypothetical protein N0V93_007706 [Gnomoniopsis smithogilvyi]|uniref:Apple domain-containing protein n=1 Tax=Gnomoniopsis smithogilvyi TaxID=1191159 RepID=A0A9W8YLM0_9PEZI|nr:hypothetical protein N0V93_007706 [Gnomoniopsis smithogilvyi]